MSLCCIGGVCIPTSAVVPLLLWVLKYAVEMAAKWGLLGESNRQKLEDYLVTKPKKEKRNKRSKSCCGEKSCELVTDADTQEELETLIETYDKVIVKWSASWCKPCKAIHPYYEELAAKHSNIKFVVADADECDDFCAEHGVVALPTFLAFEKEEIVDRYAGSSQELLTKFVDKFTKN